MRNYAIVLKVLVAKGRVVMLLKIVLILIVIWLILRRWQKRRLMQCCGQFKNDILALPVIGHAYMAMGNGEAKIKAFQAFGREAVKQGGITTILQSWLLDRYYIVVADPVIAEFILKNCLEKDDSMRMFGVFGDGLLALPVSQWRPRRKVLNPAFNLKNLYQYVEIFKNNSNVLVEILRNEADRGPFSVIPYISAYTLDSLCETMLGTELGSLRDNEHPIMNALMSSCTLISNRMCLPWLHNQTVYETVRPTECALLKKYSDVLYAFVSKFIPSEYKTSPTEAEIQRDYKRGPKNYKTIIQLMIEATSKDVEITEKYLRDEIIIVMIGGMETSAITMSFILKLLAKYPEVQQKLYQEIIDICGDSSKEIKPEHFPNMKYMEAVIKETLRLYPPGSVLLRKPDRDMELPNGKTLVKDMGVLINVWTLNRHPDYWGPDPDCFRPERWEEGLKHPAAFLGFSYGARNCIGYQYAILSLKTALATTLRNFIVKPANMCEDKQQEIRLTFDIFIRDVEGYKIQLKSR